MKTLIPLACTSILILLSFALTGDWKVLIILAVVVLFAAIFVCTKLCRKNLKEEGGEMI